MDPRGTLDAAREAAEEARRVRRQLARLDAGEQSRTPEPYRASLLYRLDLCKRAADEGRDVLDAMAAAGIAPGWTIDAMQLRYVDACPWDEVSEVVGYSVRHIQTHVRAALDAASGRGTTGE